MNNLSSSELVREFTKNKMGLIGVEDICAIMDKQFCGS